MTRFIVLYYFFSQNTIAQLEIKLWISFQITHYSVSTKDLLSEPLKGYQYFIWGFSKHYFPYIFILKFTNGEQNIFLNSS